MNLALFDLDNTLLDGDSDHLWAQFLIGKGCLDPETHRASNDRFFQQYQDGALDIHEFLRFQLAPLAREKRATLDLWHAEFMRTEILPRRREAGARAIAQHLQSGALVALVTATNTFVTAPIARAFGIPHLIATVAEQDAAGNFTGQVLGTPSFQEGKIVRVEQWLQTQALHWGAFAQTWFYSDSRNDLPLLAKVSHPVAVTPDEALAAHARSVGWDVQMW